MRGEAVARNGTISAIATAPGRGGVAIVRVSGPDAFAVAARLCEAVPRPGRVRFAHFRHPADGVLLDAGLLLAFRAPHSYTGEDVVEFQCHGGTVTPRRILEATFAAGARLARRGEFTERAFLNGRLALDQAGAVLDLIDAKTDRAADAALAELAVQPGGAGTSGGDATLRALYDAALSVASTLEHALDIDEGELPADFTARVAAEIADLRAQLAAARTRARERALLRQGALVVLAGPPNAGKSSLLNALAGESRAIVSDVPGTTRDAVEIWLDLDGWPVRLVDTAGLRETADAIEAEGVRRSAALIAEAAVVLDLGAGVDSPKVIPLLPKCDLFPPTAPARPRPGLSVPSLRVSAKTGEGLDALRQAIVARLAAQAAAFSEDVGDARTALYHEALALLDHLPQPLDLVLAGNLLQRVCARLGAELGVTYTDDLLDRIFSRFCVGK